MPNIGPVQAAGKTVGQLEAELEEKYQKELNDNDVVVVLAASANVVYVTGQVGRPGRVQLDRPLTALEAILEVGGFLSDANMKRIMVTRWENNINQTWILNLKPLYEGAPVSPFYLHPRDSVYVPKKVQWF
jgi:polysaccharide export outer membrane protein